MNIANRNSVMSYCRRCGDNHSVVHDFCTKCYSLIDTGIVYDHLLKNYSHYFNDVLKSKLDQIFGDNYKFQEVAYTQAFDKGIAKIHISLRNIDPSTYSGAKDLNLDCINDLEEVQDILLKSFKLLIQYDLFYFMYDEMKKSLQAVGKFNL